MIATPLHLLTLPLLLLVAVSGGSAVSIIQGTIHQGPTINHPTQCEINITSAGLPHRTEPLLARERRSFPDMVASLFTSAKGEAATPPLTAEALSQALGSSDPIKAYAAAFLIGRCRATDPTVDQALTHCLEVLLRKQGKPAAPGSDILIEAAMSLILRGKTKPGRETLLHLLHSTTPLGDQYKAAFYLAQLGDTSGYGALLGALQSDIPHYRLMALRHALAFAQYDGQIVNGTTIDVRKLLVDCLADPDEIVRSEVPFYLEELHPADLRTLLQPVERSDPSRTVRTAAWDRPRSQSLNGVRVAAPLPQTDQKHLNRTQARKIASPECARAPKRPKLRPR